MKILIVNKFLHPNGGSETYIFKIGESLSEKGNEVQFFGMEHEGRIVSNRVGSYTTDMDFHGGGKLSKLTYPIKTIYSGEARKKIRAVLDDFQPDVVHLNNFSYQLTPSIIVEIEKWRKKNGKNCKIVFTAHDYNLVCPNHTMLNPNTGEKCGKCLGGHYLNCVKGRCIHGSLAKSAVGSLEGWFWKKKKTYRYIDTIICCSGFLKKQMDTNPIFREKTVALHNFIETRNTEKSEKKDYVLYFGRFSKEKGITTLLKVCEELPEINFVFAGSGPLEDEVKKGKNIRFVGFKTGEELKRLIGGARFSVYPSEWYENCPLSVIESQNLLTPVVGADIGGIPELIRAGETGELFESGNADALKRAILGLWNYREKLEKYTENCRGLKFDTLDEYTDRLLNKFYRS